MSIITQFGNRVVNGILRLGGVISKLDFPDDTIYVETQVLEKRASRSKPDRGIVKLKHLGKNQRGEVICAVERTVLILKHPSEKILE